MKLIIEGVGYRAALEGNNIVLNIGLSHQVKLAIPEGVEVKVEKNFIRLYKGRAGSAETSIAGLALLFGIL